MNKNTTAMMPWPQSCTNPEQWQQLTTLIAQLEPNQKIWLSGYLAAVAQSPAISPVMAAPASTPNADTQLTILYGSQTGNSESVAQQLLAQAASVGLRTELYSLTDFTVKNLVNKSLIALIISTHGEGEAPDDAELFYEQLFANKAPNLKHLKYSVLALGDTSYELFCQTGKEIDERLTALEATNIFERIDCDVDFEEDAKRWVDGVVTQVEIVCQVDQQNDNITALPLNDNIISPTQAAINKANPYAAEILNIQKITGRGSSKNTYHIELAVDPHLIQYQAGDSLAVIAKNSSQAVDQLLAHWQVKANKQFKFKGLSGEIKNLITEHVEITQISKPLVQYLTKHINHPQLHKLATSHQHYEAYCDEHQILELLQEFDPNHEIPIQATLDQLKRITPRLYSIASAQSVTEDEIHLTVNLADATPGGLLGLTSSLLCQRAEVGDLVPVYIESNNNFRLPENPATPVIMIGPGTGIAPYRAFLQQRQHQQATGENWLIFGNPHFNTDFLYQAEWLKLQKSGLINHLDVAFSRDQVQKIYVQNKLQDQALRVWTWLEKGANLYLCGNANRMAKDVEQTLINIISEQGHLTTEAAKIYLKTLKRANRYQKDVY